MIANRSKTTSLLLDSKQKHKQTDAENKESTKQDKTLMIRTNTQHDNSTIQLTDPPGLLTEVNNIIPNRRRKNKRNFTSSLKTDLK